jgi:hypothetical protein
LLSVGKASSVSSQFWLKYISCPVS